MWPMVGSWSAALPGGLALKAAAGWAGIPPMSVSLQGAESGEGGMPFGPDADGSEAMPDMEELGFVIQRGSKQPPSRELSPRKVRHGTKKHRVRALVTPRHERGREVSHSGHKCRFQPGNR